MFVVHKLEGVGQKLLAAFELVDGRIVFDDARGDREFVDALRARGVPARDARGAVVHIMPDADGAEFVEACMTLFDGVHIACNDEEELAEARRAFDVVQSNSAEAAPLGSARS
ncbi:MAG: hypothetical protein ACHREM_13215 [Polyangiales bacterium]